MIATALAAALIARRYGIGLPEEVLRAAAGRGDLGSDRALVRFFHGYGLDVGIARARLADLKRRGSLYPLAAELAGGQAVVLLGPPRPGDDGTEGFAILDPANPSALRLTMPVERFVQLWNGRIATLAPLPADGGASARFGPGWLGRQLARNAGSLGLCLVLSLLLNALSLLPVIFLQVALDKVVGYRATGTLYVLTGGVALALMFNGLFLLLRERLIQFIGTRIEARLAAESFDRLLGLPARAVANLPPGRVAECFAGVAALRGFVAGRLLPRLFDLSALLVFLPLLLAYSVDLTLVVFAFGAAMTLTTLGLKAAERRRGLAGAAAERDQAALLTETIAGLDSVKALAQEGLQRQAWRRAAAAGIRVRAARDGIAALSASLSTVLQQLMMVAVISLGIGMVFDGSLTVGALVAVNLIGARTVRPVVKAATLAADLKPVAATVEQLAGLWAAAPERRAANLYRTVTGHFDLRDVTVDFGSGRPALSGLSVTLPARQRTAVVGPAGAGRSTLCALLQGTVPPTAGVLLADQMPVAQLNPDHYRRQVVAVTGEPAFFRGTIEENIRRVRPELGDQEMEEIFRLALFLPVLRRLPAGLATVLDEKAAALSRSERQKLALARALAMDPRVLILDDPFTAFDRASQLALRETLPAIAAARTLILAGSDLGLVRDFDAILVLDEGQLKGYGRHAALMKDCPVYAAMWETERRLAEPWRLETSR